MRKATGSDSGKGVAGGTTPGQESGRRERVLQAAARLFALEGFHGVSMRDIAKEADVGLPLVVYHFETKLNLYKSIFDQHKHLFAERLEELRAATEEPGPDLVERIVHAFVAPIMRSQTTEEGVVYAQLVAREASDPREESRGIIAEYFDPMAREFVKALKKAVPEKSVGFLEWAYLFAVGALVMNVFDARITRISEGKVHPGDIEKKTVFLTSFIAAGIRGGPTGSLAGTSSKASTSKARSTPSRKKVTS